MDIRTKLVFTLVAVSLGGMFAVGAVAYTAASELLKQSSLRQLESLAEVKEDKLEDVLVGWQDRVNLIASRTQLRLSLREHDASGDPEPLARIQRILDDARQAVRTVERITVYDADGQRVVSTTSDPAADARGGGPQGIGAQMGPVYLKGIRIDEGGRPLAEFVAPLVLERERVGSIYVVLNADELLDVTRNYTGLGETGETLIVVREDSTGAAWIVNAVRHGGTRPGPLTPTDRRSPSVLASEKREGVFSRGLVDYRGEPVWAAIRYLPEPDWGLVVKFDAAEERAAIVELRQRLTRLGLSLSAFAILLGTVLGLWFARPIHDLAEAADRIRSGDLEARAPEGAHDEVGLLARTFNEMADELERRIKEPAGTGDGDPGSRADSPERSDA